MYAVVFDLLQEIWLHPEKGIEQYPFLVNERATAAGAKKAALCA
jgi:hypothetical protein